ncbi:MAG: DNA polymerase III subunit delta [Lachnospiraceae bacterium]|nr:DNA polymerase III subunit delta [Lachnospiraceae bacterium]
MENIKADIKNRTFKPVYLLCGEEEYLKNSYKNQLFKAVAGDDTMNTLVMDGKDADPVKVKDFVDTMPFFADYRTVLLTDTGLFSSTSEEWAKIIAALNDTSVVIFVESKVDKRNKLYKTVKDKGYVCEMKKPDERTMKIWIASILKKEGKAIRESACEELLLRAGDNMENLKAQLDKIISYCADKQEVTVDDIASVCSVQPQSEIFKMIDAASEGRTDVAIAYYYDMLSLREPSMRILFMIGKQCNQLLCVRELMAGGMNSSGIATRMGLMPFIVNKLIRQAKAFSSKQLMEYVQMCVKNEELVKTGRMDEKIAVETALIKICNRT